MSKRKGLSVDEKRDKILEIFHESADVFVLKDIEKIASKRGVVLQTIKEILQSLVDDDLVHMEKIGSSNYFWSFPAEASTKIINDISKAQKDIQAAQARQQLLRSQVAAAKEGKEDTDQRAQLMEQMKQLQQLLTQQTSELAQYAASDPETVAAMQQATQAAKEAANRWLDNQFALQSWCKRKFEGRGAELDAFFKDCGFDEDAAYLE